MMKFARFRMCLARVGFATVDHNLAGGEGFPFQELLEPVMGERKHTSGRLLSDTPLCFAQHAFCLKCWKQDDVKVVSEKFCGLVVQLRNQMLDFCPHAPAGSCYGPSCLFQAALVSLGDEVVQVLTESLDPPKIALADMTCRR